MDFVITPSLGISGFVVGVLLINLLLGSLPGIAIGSHLAAKVPERALCSMLATVLLLVGSKLS